MIGESNLDLLIEELLSDAQYNGHPLREALFRKDQQFRRQLERLERIASISDGFQSITLTQNITLSERYDKQLRKIEKITRISDRYQSMLRDLNFSLEKASTHDFLTGLGNRRMLLKRLDEELNRVQHQGKPLVLAILDIDRFKQVNDTWGHDIGDGVLVEISRCMQASIRTSDLCGRWGGEEFLLILPDTNLEGARLVIERVHNRIRALSIPAGGKTLSITASIGIAEQHPDENYPQTLNRADIALYEAKSSGRDKCIYAKNDAADM